jgi:nitronate monooxygenase
VSIIALIGDAELDEGNRFCDGTGVTANWLRQSLVAAGHDPANMREDVKPNFENALDDAKAWKNVWSAGQGVGTVTGIEPMAALVARLKQEYDAACKLPRFDAKE